METYNVKKRLHANKFANRLMHKPEVKQFFLEMLDKAGLSESDIAEKWTDAVKEGWGVGARHKDALQALTMVTKMRGLLDNKSAHLRININQKADDMSYDKLLEEYKKSREATNKLIEEGEILKP